MPDSNYWQRAANRRIGRRAALKAGAATSAGMALWLAGCSGGSSGSSTTPAPSSPAGGDPTKPDYLNRADPPRAGGRLQVSVPASFDTFDPHLGAAVAVQLFPRIYNVLVNQSAQRPEFLFFDLAQSMENPDPTTWVFKIRPGVRIGPNDLGVPERDLTAEDVVASFERIKATAQAVNGAFVKDWVASVKASGDSVTITTPEPYAWFLSRSGNFVNTIPPRELLADALAGKMRDRSAGAGPFRLTSSTEGQGAKFDRNPSYYRKDDSNAGAALPYLDGFDVRTISDRASWRTAFLSGQLHFYNTESKAEADSFAGDARWFMQRAPAYNFVPVTMNPERDPFRDSRARRAVALAIDRAQYVDVIYRGDAKPNGLVHWPVGLGTYAFTEDELKTLQPHDIAQARALVDAMGGLKIKVIYPLNAAIAQHDKHVPIFYEQMKAAGIEVEQDPKDFPTWLGDYRARNYELSLGLTQPIESPDQPLAWHAANGPFADRSFGVGLGDPAIDAALTKTRTTLDFNERVQAVRDAQKVIWSKDPTFLPIVCGYNYTAYAKSVHNVPDGLGSTSQLLNTWWLDT